MKATLKTGDFVELHPADRDTLRRVGIVGEVNEYADAWYFEAVTLAVDPNNGKFYSSSLDTHEGKYEGVQWRRLKIADVAEIETPSEQETPDGVVGL